MLEDFGFDPEGNADSVFFSPMEKPSRLFSRVMRVMIFSHFLGGFLAL